MQPLQAESAVKENRILASGGNTARAVTSPEEVRLAEEIIASIQEDDANMQGRPRQRPFRTIAYKAYASDL